MIGARGLARQDRSGAEMLGGLRRGSCSEARFRGRRGVRQEVVRQLRFVMDRRGGARRGRMGMATRDKVRPGWLRQQWRFEEG